MTDFAASVALWVLLSRGYQVEWLGGQGRFAAVQMALAELAS